MCPRIAPAEMGSLPKFGGLTVRSSGEHLSRGSRCLFYVKSSSRSVNGESAYLDRKM